MEKNYLDQAEIYKRFDAENSREHWENFPDELAKAGKMAREWVGERLGGMEKGIEGKGFEKVEKIIICGMGGSGMAGLITKAGAERFLNKPLEIVQGYDLPTWVDSDCLILLVSYSGNTEEVLSCAEKAKERGAMAMAITNGGKLENLAEKENWPIFKIDYQAPPRAALAHLLAGVWEIVAWVENGRNKSEAREEINWVEMAKNLKEKNKKYFTGIAYRENEAKKIAEFGKGKRLMIISGEHLGAAAKRWKTQINENAKQWAECEFLPELNHNFTESLSFPIDARIGTAIILLESEFYNSRVARRMAWLAKYFETSGWSYKRIKFDREAHGESRGHVEGASDHGNGAGEILGEILEAIALGDWTSYYLAMLNQVDPTPVQAIEESKKYLSTCQ